MKKMFIALVVLFTVCSTGPLFASNPKITTVLFEKDTVVVLDKVVVFSDTSIFLVENEIIDEKLIAYLDKVVVFMKENPTTIIRIMGHSDNSGTLQETEENARTRAKNVRNYLVKNGIPLSRVFAGSNGARIPIAPPDTEEGRRQNRRVEIILQKQ